MTPASNEMLGSLLKNTSRSFYLTLRVLPGEIRSQIGLAYLLARTSDTIADTQLLALNQRVAALRAFGARIEGSQRDLLDFRDFTRHQSSEAEQSLLENCESSLSLLQSFTPEDQRLVREVLRTILSGQELDLQRFAGASGEKIAALGTDEELDDYTYRVAGCVGEFWTRMCFAHIYRTEPGAAQALLPSAVRFGKGLQLVNILRDLAVDLVQGRCYLPQERLSQAGLTPADLRDPKNEPRLRPLYNGYLNQAQEHLAAGWAYTNALPGSSARVRLACAWPILIGLKTLSRLRTGNVLDLKGRIKISRAEVKSIILRSVLYYAWPRAWKRLVRGPGE
jgi:farnesyl-diphosphate farnesyltransferase